VHLCAVRADEYEVKKSADELYDALQKSGIEVLYDDRSVSAGVMFSDADLMGIPIRLIISPRNLKNNICELVSRDKKINMHISIDNIVGETKKIIASMF